ncbi:MAG: tryptophanase, partial [Chlorobi bacterium]|nr:tryptophanase [Chlorobiota bacterium]
EPGYADKTPLEIAKEMFSYADGCTMSAKKDALVNMGGFIALRNEEWAQQFRNILIITEGFPTYGGLSGRDLEAIAQGLDEVLDEDYLHYRIISTAYLADHIAELGVPILQPPGGHAVYVDAKAMCPHIPVEQYPGQAIVCGLYLEGGVRAVEIGSVMFGKYDDDGKLVPAPMELVRLAIPRRVYTQSHMDYVVEVFEELVRNRELLRGVRIVKEAPMLRHFTAQFEYV